MRRIIVLGLLCLCFQTVFAQKPKNGRYTYSIAFAEWQGKSLGATCTVKIRGDSIYVLHNGKKNLSGNAGDTLDAGIIMKHKSGNWIIGHNKSDKYLDEYGGCTGGPTIIDFKRKRYWTC